MEHAVKTGKTPPAKLTIPSDRIDVYRMRLAEDVVADENLLGILSRDELARASRFQFDRDRSRFTRGRAGLRILLGRYLDVAPGEIRFRYQNNGKPEIDYPPDTGVLRFNVSNSGELVLIAVTAGTPLGIDVEKMLKMTDVMDIATRYFSAREVQALRDMDESKRQVSFFACWTRKEAFLKVTGAGMSYPLSAFSVTVDPDGPADTLEIGGEKSAAARWSLKDLNPQEGYRAALAWDGGFREIKEWEFDVSLGHLQ